MRVSDLYSPSLRLIFPSTVQYYTPLRAKFCVRRSWVSVMQFSSFCHYLDFNQQPMGCPASNSLVTRLSHHFTFMAKLNLWVTESTWNTVHLQQPIQNQVAKMVSMFKHLDTHSCNDDEKLSRGLSVGIWRPGYLPKGCHHSPES